ncbi:MAG: hypothetical protein LBR80_16170 [Deltaproteobacteria bacterium]|jgi:hypothetical protein|nr:hypothetical protein [Deltaproteobacteria bacterium]
MHLSTSCLGGISVSPKHSPIKRINDDGIQTSYGRQIDCRIEESAEVYEIKLRVTNAASGQGRFKEEMSFPVEAERAGFTPTLIVFDSTPSDVFEKLKLQYINHGGRFATGPDAWKELIMHAGKEMGYFILKYIKPPIELMGAHISQLPGKIFMEANNDFVIIRDENGKEYKINRSLL